MRFFDTIPNTELVKCHVKQLSLLAKIIYPTDQEGGLTQRLFLQPDDSSCFSDNLEGSRLLDLAAQLKNLLHDLGYRMQGSPHQYEREQVC